MFRSVTREWVAKLDWPKNEARTGLPPLVRAGRAVGAGAGERHRDHLVAVGRLAEDALLALAAVVGGEQHPVARP